MGGVCFFNLAVDTPNGDMALLEKVGAAAASGGGNRYLPSRAMRKHCRLNPDRCIRACCCVSKLPLLLGAGDGGCQLPLDDVHTPHCHR